MPTEAKLFGVYGAIWLAILLAAASVVFARRMIQQAEKAGDEEAPAGSIINISSIAARRTQPELLAYSVSVAAVDQLTRAMAVALAPAFNPERFTDPAKSEKWFRRNCNDVLARECTAAEKADVLAWLISLKR